MSRKWIPWGVVVVALTLGGCSNVQSEYPASDASSHTLDEGLLGLWKAEYSDPTAGSREKTWFLVGKRTEAEVEYDAILVESFPDHRLETSRGRFFATRIGNALGSYEIFRLQRFRPLDERLRRFLREC